MESKVEGKISKNKETSEKKLLAVIRISGILHVRNDMADTLDRLMLRRKYSCVLISSNNKNLCGMLKKIRNFISYGVIDENILEKLVKERGKSIEGNKKKIKIDTNDVVKGLVEGKKLNEFGLKSFFRLHPPRGGIRSKLHYPKGVLGENKEINKLIERML